MSDSEYVRQAVERYGPILGRQRAALGAERFEAFVNAHGKVQAMLLFLVMSVAVVPRADYSDEALQAIEQDARDLQRAADELAGLVDELAGYWRVQRQESER